MRGLKPSALCVTGFLGSSLVLRDLVPIDALASVSKSNRSTKTVPTTTGRAGGGGFGSSKKVPDFVHTRDDTEATQRLVQFVTVQGARGLENVDIGFHQETGIRGLFCTKDVKKGQFICQIPSDCALALSDPARNGDDAPTVAHGGANLLEIYIHNAQAKRTWAPYLDTLPTYGSDQFDPTPDFFVGEDLELLEFPRIIRMAKDRQEQIHAVAAERGMTGVDELQFATWLTASRAFELSLSGPSTPPTPVTDSDDGGGDKEAPVPPNYDDRGQVITRAQQKKVRVLIPLIDLANHSSDQPNCKLALIDPQKDDAWFALEATRPIAAGKELVLAYGNGVQSTVELLSDYGFVPSTNRIDSMMLKRGGEGCITSLDGWTTTLEEDRTMLTMAKDDPTLQKILSFRIRLKESYDG